MSQTDVKQEIERLIRFGLHHGLIEEMDLIPVRNALLDLFQVAEPYTGEIEHEDLENATAILESLLDYAAKQGMLSENNTTHRDLLDAKIMGLLMPRQSEIARQFWLTAESDSIEQATENYYRLSRASNYIRTERIRKDEYWLTPTDYGDLEISINLSKPEKDPKDIAAEKRLPQSSYPQCLLCFENVGYAGRLNHPARQNHRIIPLQLDGAPWGFQYSPYLYYNEHSIIFSKEHIPMKISSGSFVKLLDFVRQFPHYFIGANADLPIVGGSILSHDHFQGGKHCFPMEKAPLEQSFAHKDHPAVKIGIVRWPLSVIRISGPRHDQLVTLATVILEGWRAYSDPSVEIYAFTKQQGIQTPHNTITPIARRNKAGEFELDLVLRNNRTTIEHPLGLFHPHQELHHIKKENIGLIEVMGLAVLPGRLKRELEEINLILEGKSTELDEIKHNDQHSLHKHSVWISELIAEHGSGLSQWAAEERMKHSVGRKFLQVLTDAGVFKRDQKGMNAFHAFLHHLGFKIH